MTVGIAVKERILQLCKERELSVNKLSIISGVTQSTVNNIVSGRNNSATVATVKKLCDGLNISLEEFFTLNCFKTWSKRYNKCKMFCNLTMRVQD